jgi:hypothetical protein
VHRAAALAPDLPAGVVDKRLAALVRDDRDALARHSAEIVYRLAEHPEVRREVLEAPTSAFEADGVKRLETLASASLRAALA